MRLSTYLSVRYITLFISISTLFAVLFSLVELFEKSIRTQAASSEIISFVVLNSAPTWLNLLPLTSWLAMLALLAMLNLQKEWDTMAVLGIEKRKIIRPLTLTLIGVTLSVLTLKTICIDALSFKADSIHARSFRTHKTKHLNIISNRWFLLSPSLLAHVSEYDQKTKMGRGLTLYLSGDTALPLYKTNIPEWRLNTATLTAPQMTLFEFKTGKTSLKKNESLSLPSLSYHLSAARLPPSWIDVFVLFISYAQTTHAARRALALALHNHLVPIYESFLIPLLSLIAFSATSSLISQPLIACALIYPLFNIAKSLLQKAF